MYKIDMTDLAIVNLLMEDGRMSCSDIARRLGNITERSVRYRLEHMLDEGIIRIGAIANPITLGYQVIADVFIEVEPTQIMEVAHKLAGFECVRYVACSTGERDVSVQVIARTNSEVYAFVTEVIARLPGVRRTNTSIVPVTLKDVYDWRIPGSSCTNGKKSTGYPPGGKLEDK
jgi:Lrp/AsnC family transcriptional regulator for asnA, asnC and gidA